MPEQQPALRCSLGTWCCFESACVESVLVPEPGEMSSLLLCLLFVVFYAVLRLARSEASPRKRRHRAKKQKPKAFGCCEEELEAGASPETCCPVPPEKLRLAQRLRLVERRVQCMARHLEEVLIPPSVSTSATSQFSYSSRESTTSALRSPSSFSLREAAMIHSEPLRHTGEIMPVGVWEGSAHPIQAQPLPRPPVHSRRVRREQTMGLDQTSVRGLVFNIRQKHLQSQLGAPTPYTESLAKMIPNIPALCPPDRDPRVKFNMSRVPFLSREVLEELDCHVQTKRLQHEQGLPVTPQKPHTALLPPAPQTPIPGEPLLGERDTKQQLILDTDRPKCGFPAKVPEPLRSNTSPQRAQAIQESCVCPSGPLPQKAHRIMASPEAILARPVPTVVVKLQDHIAQKCSEIQMEAFPKMVRESHRDAPLVRETAIAEKTLTATLHLYRSEMTKPLTSVSGTKGTEEKLELHMERKVLLGEGSCLGPGAQAGEGRAAHDLQLKHLMEMLSSSRPLAVQVSVCQQCRKAYPGKMNGFSEEEETQSQKAETESCPVPLEKLRLAQRLRLVERRVQCMARHLEEVLIPPSVSTSATSQFSSSSRESTTSALRSPSCFSLREAAMIHSEPLRHTGEIMPAHRIMASPEAILARPVPTVVVKLQDHIAQKCSEIQMEAFPKMAAHDLQLKHLMEMLSSSRPLAVQVSVCQQCRKAYPGKMNGPP
ncbi:uncharacterized protein LOC120401205 [Mauremys reevesii]|uniref:uncharacterized protein LOC120401205 n=1 Tax=Mauremys reevesii TaxID=260615 RepID=UPI00193FB40F|nr:uncharacterized protein LOC120401205 [Mauremys reevesii]